MGREQRDEKGGQVRARNQAGMVDGVPRTKGWWCRRMFSGTYSSWAKYDASRSLEEEWKAAAAYEEMTLQPGPIAVWCGIDFVRQKCESFCSNCLSLGLSPPPSRPADHGAHRMERTHEPG